VYSVVIHAVLMMKFVYYWNLLICTAWYYETVYPPQSPKWTILCRVGRQTLPTPCYRQQ